MGRRVGVNRRAMDATVKVLRELGRVDPIDAARVKLAQSLASAVDDDPLNAALWGQYRAAEAALRELHISATLGLDGTDTVDPTDQLLAEMRAEMGDASDSDS